MSELNEDDEIKQLFVDESLEGLQRVERLLLDAEQGRPRSDMVDVMFRDFHTIKGTSALLAYEKTASLAHAAEDLMSLLRDKTITAQPRHFTRMVQVVDALRRMIESTRDENTEGDFDVVPLVTQIRGDIERGNDVVAELAPVAAPPPPTPPPAPAPKPVAAPEPVIAAAAPPTPPASTAEVHDEASGARAEPVDSTVRVNVTVLDKLMNLMGELVLARNQMVQVARALRDPSAQAVTQRLSLVTTDLQEQIMKTRMQPVARVFEKIPRMARDLSQQTGKRIACEINDNATEIDKALVEAIRDPLMHIIRNSIDHGIETPDERVKKGKAVTGKLSVRAMHEGSTVSIEVKDDGAGVDPVRVKQVAVKRNVISQAEADRLTDREAIDLIFRPGFSTAEKVSSISGRGVGMDVVRTHVERAGGVVELESTVGKGTTLRMKMPLTLAILPALLVRDGGQRFAIPQANLLELVFLDERQVGKAIEYVRGAPIYRLRGEVLPLVRLAPLLGREQVPTDGVSIVVVAVGQRRYGLIVESIQDTEEIVIKPLHALLGGLPCYAGATVLGDGGVALILDVGGMATMAGIDLSTARRLEMTDATERKQAEGTQVLVFEAGANTRCAVPVSMVARLEQVNASNVELVAGQRVLQYRDDIMPILAPDTHLPVGAPPESDTLALIVFNFGKPVALAVTRIIDVSDVSEHSLGKTELPHVFGQAVIFGKTTLLLDVFGLVRAQAPACIEGAGPPPRKPRVLLADEVDAMRASIAGFLRARGVDVVELDHEGLARAMRSSDGPIDAVVAGVDHAPERGLELVRALSSEQPEVPVVCVAKADSEYAASACNAGARSCVPRIERQAIFDALTAAGVFNHEAARSP